MTSESLSFRLTAILDANKSTLQFIQRLAKLSFQPGFAPLDGESDVRAELSSEIHESLRQQEEQFELVREEVGEFVASKQRNSQRDQVREKLRIQVERLKEDLKHSRTLFRKAQLQAKRNAEQARRKERELLFVNSQDSATTVGRRRGQEKLSQEEIVANKSSDVTAALRQTHHLMQAELSRSRFAQETLNHQTAALAQLSEHYSTVDNLLASSRNLVKALIWSQKSDTWYLQTAVYILLATFCWLFFRRILWGPFWLFLWQPLRIAYRVTSWIFAAAGLTGIASQSPQAYTPQLPTSSHTSLIIQHSATGKPPKIMAGGQAPYVRVGGGGKGGPGPDPSLRGEFSRSIAEMEVSQQARATAPGNSGKSDHDTPSEDHEKGEEPVLRGDGQPLKPRDRPPNPKKRMFDTKIEDKKHEEEMRNRDEL